ncbi:MAG: MarR family transcriptional regulator [Caldimonas sp.]
MGILMSDRLWPIYRATILLSLRRSRPRAYRSNPYPLRAVVGPAREDDRLLLKSAQRRLKLATRDYAQLASFRNTLRTFLRFSEAAAAQEGLSTQHYQAMLILRGWPDGQPVSINDLAQQLLIRHNSAVGLVDRLVKEGLVVREPSTVDRRKVELRLSSRGRHVLAKLAATHRDELRRLGPIMKRFFSGLTHDHADSGN